MVYSDSRNTDGVRRRPLPLIGTYHKISIHAPLTGCDFSLNINNADVEQISIHAPLTGCDIFRRFFVPAIDSISIHAPLTGCDAVLVFDLADGLLFQSTHP